MSYILEKSLGLLATRFSRNLLRRIDAVFSQQGIPITAQQYSLLVQVWDHNGLPQGALAEKTARDKTTMARLAANLETSRLLVRLPSPDDSRERLIYLTEQGKSLMDQATELVQEILVQAQAGIDKNDLEACRNVLRRAYENLLK
ncbi:MAG: hypothetical protein C0621_03280 [Desulfuromonas sp.]|nr:MAG: hypothetical protein C0621_03280 [Desulfuromonas sp.]